MIDSVFVDDLQIHDATAVAPTLRVRTLRGLGSPAPRTVTFPHASRHGAIDQTRYYDGRVLELEGAVVAATDGAAWAAFDTLKGKLALGSTRTLRWRRRGLTGDEQVTATVSSVVDQQVSSANGSVIFWSAALFAADPRIYSATLRSGSYDPSASLSGGGVTFPVVWPMVFSTTTATQLSLTNAGQFKSPPVLTIQGPVGNPIIDNDTTGESIYLNYTLGVNDQVIVDVGARTVKLNGASRIDLFNASLSTWWEMPPGTNRLRLRGTGMAGSQTLLTAAFRDAYI